MPKVNVAISGVSIELEANEVAIGTLIDHAMDMLERANKVESTKSSGPATGFSTERRDTSEATRYYPSSIINPEVRIQP